MEGIVVLIILISFLYFILKINPGISYDFDQDDKFFKDFKYKYKNDPGFKKAIDKFTDKELEET